MLEWYHWNVDQAVNNWLTGNVEQPASYRPDPPPPPPANSSAAAAPQPAPQQLQEPGVLSRILAVPIRLALSTLSYALKPLTYMLGAEEPPKDGSASARRFISNFEVEYGRERCPDFLPESYREAVAKSAAEHRFLAVYLHSPLHEDTPRFCKTLISEAVLPFLNDNLLLWGGSVWHADAYAASLMLGVSQYPFMCLLICKPGEVRVIDKVEGFMEGEPLMRKVSSAMARFQSQLDRIQAARMEREAARNLVNEQDREYRETLEADRRAQEEREAAKRQKEEAEQLERQRKQSIADERMGKSNAMQSLQAVVAPEPPKGPDTARLRIQLPHGSKLDRRFMKDDLLREVRSFIALYFLEEDSHIERFSISTNFPKRTYEEEEDGLTLAEAGLHPQALLFIHDLDA
ncbi:unnamed protein product [Chrysoparadoxa australica]